MNFKFKNPLSDDAGLPGRGILLYKNSVWYAWKIFTKENFSISSGITAVANNVVYFPITLNTGKHELLENDARNNSINIAFESYEQYLKALSGKNWIHI